MSKIKFSGRRTNAGGYAAAIHALFETRRATQTHTSALSLGSMPDPQLAGYGRVVQTLVARSETGRLTLAA